MTLCEYIWNTKWGLMAQNSRPVESWRHQRGGGGRRHHPCPHTLFWRRMKKKKSSAAVHFSVHKFWDNSFCRKVIIDKSLGFWCKKCRPQGSNLLTSWQDSHGANMSPCSLLVPHIRRGLFRTPNAGASFLWQIFDPTEFLVATSLSAHRRTTSHAEAWGASRCWEK